MPYQAMDIFAAADYIILNLLLPEISVRGTGNGLIGRRPFRKQVFLFPKKPGPSEDFIRGGFKACKDRQIPEFGKAFFAKQ